MITGMWLLHLDNALCPADLNVSFWPNTVSQDEKSPWRENVPRYYRDTTQYYMATVGHSKTGLSHTY